ncbi:ATP-binding protein [Pseudonocardia sp. GCM10023141]|uniref:ATP-binding protein n=1 Tax=Pseudonocardia sp. GCM10023141 TaxID=3252653 RepID=UPI003611B77D
MLADRVVGRTTELAAIGFLLDAAAAGRGGLLALEGEAGVGKSCLARAAVRSATGRGLTVACGRASSGPSVPFRAIAEALLGLERAGGLPAELPSVGALARVVPRWGAVRSEPSLVEVAEAMLRLLARMGDAVLLVLEDLHWADPETLAVVEYLGDNLAGQPIAVLATVRPEPPSAAALIGRLAARRSAVHLGLATLAPHEVLALARACLELDTFDALGAGAGAGALPAGVDELLERAEGLPLLVEDLLGAAARSGALCQDDAGTWRMVQPPDPYLPVRFADTVSDRLATLDADAREVLGVAAILGRRFDDALLGAITGLGEDAVLAALQAGYRTQLLTRAGTAFEFRHALTRDVVLDALLPPVRARLSRAAADALETTAQDGDCRRLVKADPLTAPEN